MNIKRHIESIIDYGLKQTKVLLVTGLRQSGKTFIMQNHYKKYEYVTFDDNNELITADKDPQLFFKDRTYPLIIDEAQYSQNIFRTVKLIVDKSKKRGQLILTGSQSFDLMEKVNESLAGRISIIEMSNLSLREIAKVQFSQCFVPSKKYIKSREKELVDYKDLWGKIHRGQFPELTSDKKRNWEWFYRDYINTYLEKDIRKIINIKNEISFKKFLVCIAARTGNEIVYDEIASEVGKDAKTIKEWISIVAQTGLIKMVHTYKNSVLKRMIKNPKLYFMDTGLVCYLVGWKTKEQAKNGAMAGSLFETFVFSEIAKSYLNAGKALDNIYYYRDKDKKEIDFIIEENGILYPIEIKMSATIDIHWDEYNNYLSKVKNKKVEKITVICQVDKKYVHENMMVLPVSYI